MSPLSVQMLSVSLLCLLAGTVWGEEPSRDGQGDELPAGAVARLGTIRFRHGGAIMALAYSPDGKTLATIGYDNRVSLWDAGSGQERQRFVASGIGSGDWDSLAFSPDGRILAVAGWEVRLWDVTARRLLPETVHHPNYVKFAAFSPNGKVLAVGGLDGTISFWPMPTGKRLRELTADAANEQWFRAAAFSPDGRMLASASDQGLVRLWAVDTGRELRRFRQHGMLHSVAFAPDGRSLAVASIHDDDIHLWDPSTGKEVRRWKAHTGGVLRLAFDRDGKILASAGWASGEAVLLSDPTTGRHLRRLPMPEGLLALAFSPDGKTLAAAGHGNAVRFWDPSTGKQRHLWPGHEGPVTSLTFTDDAGTLASAATDHSVRLWSLAQGRERSTPTQKSKDVQPSWFGPHQDQVDAVVLSPEGKTLAIAHRTQIRLWELPGSRELPSPELHEERWEHFGQRSCAFSRDGKTLAYDEKGAIRLWSVPTGKPLRSFGRRGEVRSFLFLDDDRRLLTVGRDGKTRCWEVATGKELFAHEAWAGDGCAVTPDGRMMASEAGEAALLFDLVTGKKILQRDWYPHERIASVALSPDGRTLATGGNDKDQRVRLWEVATGGERRRFVGHRGSVRTLAFCRDGRLLASGSTDTTVLVWDVFALNGLNVPVRPGKLRPEELGRLWEQLAHRDAALAYGAICTLVASSSSACALLKERLRPVPAVSAAAIAELIANLDSDTFAIREKASRDLARLEKAAEQSLRQALRNSPSAEQERRVRELLAKTEWLRAVRAVEVLERIATPEARQLLEALAGGAADARLTQEAQLALQRAAIRSQKARKR